MIRPLPFVPALIIAAVLLLAAPAAAAPTTDPDAQSAVSVEFEPTANNGLHAQVDAFLGDVTLEITRKGRSVSYEIPGEITEAGLKAQFGDLGLIDVAFRPTRTLRTDEPPKQCKGEPSTFREGLFIGTIEFTGEREYVRIAAAKVEGRMFINREPEWRCPHQKRPMRVQGAPRLSTPGTRERFKLEKEPATVSAFSRRCRCLFLAIAEPEYRGRGRSGFLGAKLENREGMEIVRETRASAGASAFVYDHAAGTASVHPPQPFNGNGTFKRRPHGRDLWRSTIRVPLLGADPLSVRGRGFRVGLVRDLPGD
jgi:hypothetical protein